MTTTIGYDNPGRVTTENSDAYVDVDQLTKAVVVSLSTACTFDARGNGTKATTGTAVTTYAYDQDTVIAPDAPQGRAATSFSLVLGHRSDRGLSPPSGETAPRGAPQVRRPRSLRPCRTGRPGRSRGAFPRRGRRRWWCSTTPQTFRDLGGSDVLADVALQRPPQTAARRLGAGSTDLVGVLARHVSAADAPVAAHRDDQRGGSPSEGIVRQLPAASCQLPGDGVTGNAFAAAAAAPLVRIEDPEGENGTTGLVSWPGTTRPSSSSWHNLLGSGRAKVADTSRSSGSVG